jgi:peroxisomal trans-2-enoyl-CoA reductase
MAHNLFSPSLFAGKTCIVTGGGTGIGACIASTLLNLGANVVIASRKLDKLQITCDELSKTLPKHYTNTIIPIQANIRIEEEVKNLFQQTIKRFGKLDMLVNNGGGQFPSPASQISANGWRSVIDLNLNGTFLCCREAFLQCMNEHGGSIVNITCDFHNGFPGMAHTGAARAGVANLTKSLATEWAPNKVRINCVAPGVIYNESADAHYDKATGTKGVLEAYIPHIPARRLGSIEEVAAAVVFLLSPGASYISGISLQVDGAQHLTPGTPATFVEHNGWPEWKGGKL